MVTGTKEKNGVTEMLTGDLGGLAVGLLRLLTQGLRVQAGCRQGQPTGDQEQLSAWPPIGGQEQTWGWPTQEQSQEMTRHQPRRLTK